MRWFLLFVSLPQVNTAKIQDFDVFPDNMGIWYSLIWSQFHFLSPSSSLLSLCFCWWPCSTGLPLHCARHPRECVPREYCWDCEPQSPCFCQLLSKNIMNSLPFRYFVANKVGRTLTVLMCIFLMTGEAEDFCYPISHFWLLGFSFV